MKFIKSFLECLVGLAIIGIVVWLSTFPLSAVKHTAELYPMMVNVIVMFALGVFLVVDAIKRGNK